MTPGARSGDYGSAYARILVEMVRELEHSKRLGRGQKRIVNARIGAWRTSLLHILQAEHGMNADQAEAAVLDSVRPWRDDSE